MVSLDVARTCYGATVNTRAGVLEVLAVSYEYHWATMGDGKVVIHSYKSHSAPKIVQRANSSCFVHAIDHKGGQSLDAIAKICEKVLRASLQVFGVSYHCALGCDGEFG